MASDSDEKRDSHDEKKHTVSSSELLSSAKLVAEAAKSTMNHETDKIDKGKVAGAAADLLGAASHYGKLDDETGIGKYLEKAENYLEKYSAKESGHSPKHEKHDKRVKDEKHEKSDSSDEKDEKDEKGFGDYLKMAQGFLKKDD